MFENPSRENGRPGTANARTLRLRPGAIWASGLVLASLACGCSLKDPYWVDPNFGESGGGGGSGGGSGGSSSGGSSFGGDSFGGTSSGGSSLGGSTSGGASTASGGTPSGGSGGATQTGGASSGGDSTCPKECKGTCCAGECVDTNADAKHCGSCDTVCSVGRSCKTGACSSGWAKSALPPAAFAGRVRPAFAPMGDKIFIWGGIDKSNNALADGAIYDPVNDSWSVISTDSQTLSPRQLASAVWTGKAMLVFGGRNAASTTYYSDAALYDPVADSWSPAGKGQAPRAAGQGGATPTTVVFYGGLTTGGGGLQGTERYSIDTNTWPATANANAPEAMIGVAMGFTDTSLFSFGGQRGVNLRTNQAYRYDIVADTWTTLPAGPSQRAFAFGVSDGTNFFVWGGRDDMNLRNDGAVFGQEWTTFDKLNAPSARSVGARQSGWAFALGPGVAVFLGGLDNLGNVVKNGGVYDIADGWTAVPPWPSGEDHEWGVAARAGGELFVWGGENTFNVATTTGERWTR